MKIKKMLSLIIALILFTSTTVMTANAKYLGKLESDGQIYKAYLSDDGLYKYIEFPNGEVSVLGYWGSQEEITIPDEIDGKKVTMVGNGYSYWPDSLGDKDDFYFTDDSSLRKINIGKNIKIIDDISLSSYNNSERLNSYLPDISKITFSEGLEIVKWNFTGLSYVVLDELVFPKSLKRIEENAFGNNGSSMNVKKIVFLGDPILEKNSLATDTINEGQVKAWGFDKKEVYFYGNALNASPDAFIVFDEEYYHATKALTIYHKPGAQGFEKFKELGYTVKTFTDEESFDTNYIQSTSANTGDYFGNNLLWLLIIIAGIGSIAFVFSVISKKRKGVK